MYQCVYILDFSGQSINETKDGYEFQIQKVPVVGHRTIMLGEEGRGRAGGHLTWRWRTTTVAEVEPIVPAAVSIHITGMPNGIY